MDRRYKVKMNSMEKLEELLQEIYDQACKQIIEIQTEMNKLTVVDLSDADVDGIAKYSKSMHDLIGDKNKAISMKFEIAKFMGEMLKHGGDANAALNDTNFTQRTKLDLKSLRSAASDNDIKYDIK